jgi:hypothetical protein
MKDTVTIPRCSLSIWKNLYDAAVSFGDIACWEWQAKPMVTKGKPNG